MRAKILEILEQGDGKPVSGEELSKKLGVSRTAVWKQVKKLRELGYRIEGATRSGYLYLGPPDLLYPREIKRGLKARVMGGEILHFQKAGSTNQIALELARKGYPEGTLVVAEEQTAGRGRWQRPWLSPQGKALLFSLILRPEILPYNVPEVTLVAGAAVARALHSYTGIQPGIKWPNDLLYQGRKFCGILVEMEAAAEQLNYLVVGIGINVNQKQSDFPPELREQAASLKLIKGEELKRVPLLQRVLETLEDDYGKYCRGGFAVVRENWLRYNITLGRRVSVRIGKEELSGEAVDLAADGSLILQLPEGNQISCNAGEILLCREETR